jgi:phosphatidylglycerol:prolipoprotein diacylglycerol transferase
MKPVLFQLGPLSVHSYGLMIAIGTLLGTLYLKKEGKKAFGLTADQVTNLVILLFAASFIGGKLFLAFESKNFKVQDLYSGNGFVFYGSFLFAVPTMLLFFRKHKIPVLPMLDIMAIVTCIVHAFGRIGCFMAGCCYGEPTGTHWGVAFTDPASSAEPLHTLLHPTQLYEAAFITVVGLILLWMKRAGLRFHGQLFLCYLLLYAIGRSVLENYRGDYVRGYVFGNVSNAQFTAGLIALTSIGLYLWLYYSKRLLPANATNRK